jgi:hypothetical protein
VKKICEINCIELYSQHPISAWNNAWSKKRKIRPEWIEVALTPAQRKFIENRSPVFRPHPRHSPTIELFIEETTMSDRDWTIAALLFPRT